MEEARVERESEQSMTSSGRRRGGSIHDVIALFDALGVEANFDLGDDQGGEKLAAKVKEVFDHGREQPHVRYGKRVEAMFEFVAASLNNCIMIKQEDAGRVYLAEELEATPPDYELVLRDGRRFLVEVKNHHADLGTPWKLRNRDRQALLRYAQLSDRPLYFAIYWSRLKLWSLVPDSALVSEGARSHITLDSAMKSNFMSEILGDVMVATTPPLTFRVYADAALPRVLHPDGHVEFTTKRVELLCAGRRLLREVERKLCLYFMLHGAWSASDSWELVLEDGAVSAIDLHFAHEEAVGGQDFQFLGPISAMISRHYDALTIRNGDVIRLRADAETDKLGIVIPPDYRGQALPLWRFRLQPNVAPT